MHDCCGAVILEVVGGGRWQPEQVPPRSGPWHTAVPSQGPSWPALRGLGPRDEQCVLGDGSRNALPGGTKAEAAGATLGLVARAILGGGGSQCDDGLYQMPTPRLVVSCFVHLCTTLPAAGERVSDRLTCLYSPGGE